MIITKEMVFQTVQLLHQGWNNVTKKISTDKCNYRVELSQELVQYLIEERISIKIYLTNTDCTIVFSR